MRARAGVILVTGTIAIAAPLAAAGSDSTREIKGTAKDDRIRGGPADEVMRGRGGDDKLWGRGGDDDLFGGKGRDRLIGGAGEDILIGGKGGDTLNGKGGFDVLVGGRGPDVIRVRDGQPDEIDCGPGRDRAIVDEVEDGVFDCEVLIEPPDEDEAPPPRAAQ